MDDFDMGIGDDDLSDEEYAEWLASLHDFEDDPGPDDDRGFEWDFYEVEEYPF